MVDLGGRLPGARPAVVSVSLYLDGGVLKDKIDANSITSDFINIYASSLSKAIGHLKGLNLVHRDIKPDNIMFREGSEVPVLVDFGIVRDLTQSTLTLQWLPEGPGTPFYSAPEQLNNNKHLIDWRTDQFSLGIVLAECIINEHPFLDSGMAIGSAISSVANHNTCTQSFSTRAKDLAFDQLIMILESWSVI